MTERDALIEAAQDVSDRFWSLFGVMALPPSMLNAMRVLGAVLLERAAATPDGPRESWYLPLPCPNCGRMRLLAYWPSRETKCEKCGITGETITDVAEQAAATPDGPREECDGWICEEHPQSHWPHGTCAGPGIPCACATRHKPAATVGTLPDTNFVQVCTCAGELGNDWSDPRCPIHGERPESVTTVSQPPTPESVTPEPMCRCGGPVAEDGMCLGCDRYGHKCFCDEERPAPTGEPEQVPDLERLAWVSTEQPNHPSPYGRVWEWRRFPGDESTRITIPAVVEAAVRAESEARHRRLDREMSALSSDKQTLMTAVTHWRERASAAEEQVRVLTDRAKELEYKPSVGMQHPAWLAAAAHLDSDAHSYGPSFLEGWNSALRASISPERGEA